MRIGVVTFPGSCDDRDARAAVASMGAEPVALWHGDGDLEIDDLADPSLPDREAELAERAFDRLSLWVQDPRFGPHEHDGLHRRTTSGSAR